MATTHKKAKEVIRLIQKSYPAATCSLNHENALQLLVATILSAQCTDARVNIVTRDLFKKYRTAHDFANAKNLEEDIRSTGFYRNKAKSIRGACALLDKKHGGAVPKTMDQMLELPGVARKTANVVLGTAYEIPTGIVVDTHVRRLSNRMGLSNENDPKKIEQDLIAIVDKKEWIDFGHQMIQHGRRVCTARAPKCADCPVTKLCPSSGKV